MNKELLYRFFNNTTTYEEEKIIRKWVESSQENYKELLRERKLYDALLLHGNCREKSGTIIKFKKIAIAISSVAAILLFTITGTLKYVDYKLEGLPNNIITVPQGQHVNLLLSDGTKVCLNAKTTMRYPQTFERSDKRLVSIDGEAYFEVSKDKERPFIVKTTQGSVEVLGTKFHLSAYKQNNQFETALIEGKVKVSTPTCQLILNPNETATLKNGELRLGRVEDSDYYRWREGLYCFKNKTFKEVLSQFEKYYDVKFKFLTREFNDRHINGKFRLIDGVDYALQILQKEINFIYKRNNESNIIYIK